MITNGTATEDDTGAEVIASMVRIEVLVRQLGVEYDGVTEHLRALQRLAYARHGAGNAHSTVARFGDGIAEEIARVMLGAGLGPVLEARATEPLTELVSIWRRRVGTGQLPTTSAAERAD